ncbi:MAG: 5-methyltetrahydropteroyltriglutamate--homocysteine S-methyltransferase, partial [Bifidobacteriales bacterium]|nr:5-methyltetrahydropteroyltriglutamate--homocysteine S-methyltransferase [Bifidobacteriales bacterium]
ALPMKKWFTTNYHYLVPEIDQDTKIALEGDKPFKEFQEAREQGIAAKPVLIGPYTFLKLARGPQGELLDPDPALVQDLAKAYATILERFVGLGADWVQLDEPYLVLDKEPGDQDLFDTLYGPILKARQSGQGKVRILLNTYFGHIGDCYARLADLGFDGIGLDLVEGRDENLAALKEHGVPEGTTIFAGLVNG